MHRILEGQNGVDVAQELLRANKLTAAFDLAPIFVNIVRVVSLPDVIKPDQIEEFDNMLSEAGALKGVQWGHDVGAYLKVVGRQIML